MRRDEERSAVGAAHHATRPLLIANRTPAARNAKEHQGISRTGRLRAMYSIVRTMNDPNEGPTMNANATRFARLISIARHENRIANYYAEVSELGFDSHGDVHPDSAWMLEGAHRVRANKAARLADRALAKEVA